MEEKKEDNAVVQPPDVVSPPATPSADSQVTVSLDELKQQVTEAQRKITELSTQNATLQGWIENHSVTQDTSATENAQGNVSLETVASLIANDPKAAAIEVNRLINEASSSAERRALEKMRTEMRSQIQASGVINDAKKTLEKEGLLDWENEITAVVRQKIQSDRTDLHKALTDTISDFKTKRDGLVKKSQVNQATTPPPAGARAESGTNPPPVTTPAEEPVETGSEWIANESKRRWQKQYGLGK